VFDGKGRSPRSRPASEHAKTPSKILKIQLPPTTANVGIEQTSANFRSPAGKHRPTGKRVSKTDDATDEQSGVEQTARRHYQEPTDAHADFSWQKTRKASSEAEYHNAVAGTWGSGASPLTKPTPSDPTSMSPDRVNPPGPMARLDPLDSDFLRPGRRR
jgi:hypothetical protein